MNHSNATLAMSSFDRTSGVANQNSSTVQPYNNFRVQTQGGPIIQGQIAKIRVGEIMFPYAIPTLVKTKNTSFSIAVTQIVFGGGGTTVSINNCGPGPVNVTLSQGFYTGAELAAAVQAQLNTVLAGIAIPIPANTFTVQYDPISASLIWQNTQVYDGTDGVSNYILEFYAGLPEQGGSAPNFSQPSLLWTMGLRDLFAKYPPTGSAPKLWNSSKTYVLGDLVRYPSPLSTAHTYQAVFPQGPTLNPPAPGVPPGTVAGQWIDLGVIRYLPSTTGAICLVPVGYPNTNGVTANPLIPVFQTGYATPAINCSTYTGLYTQYIDLCSPTLCQAQSVRDGNSNQFSVHRDLICRLYITNEVSLFQTDPTGTRPFVIHRQFKNAKVIKWSVDRSIDAIDIQLYDQYGNPVPPLIGYIPTAANNPNNLTASNILQGQPCDFSLTFLVDEQDTPLVSQSENVGYRY